VDFDELYKSIIPTEQSILEQVDEYTLYCFYVDYDNIPLHRALPCPYRSDTTPSFSIYESNSGLGVDYMWKDSASDESGTIFKLIQKIFNLSRTEVYSKINEDFGLGYSLTPVEKREKISYYDRPNLTDIKIRIAPIPFTEQGRKYWEQFRIDKALLELYKVDQIKWYWSYNEQKAPFTVPDPTFSYRTGEYYQIYSPFAEKAFKFRNDLPDNYFFGYIQLPSQGEKLIIDKSCKDVIFCRRLGYEAICARSEGTMIPDSKMMELKDRFKEIYLTLDPDMTGERTTKKYLDKYPWIKPRFLKEAKDKTDLCKAVGFERAKTIIDEMLV